MFWINNDLNQSIFHQLFLKSGRLVWDIAYSRHQAVIIYVTTTKVHNNLKFSQLTIQYLNNS